MIFQNPTHPKNKKGTLYHTFLNAIVLVHAHKWKYFTTQENNNQMRPIWFVNNGCRPNNHILHIFPRNEQHMIEYDKQYTNTRKASAARRCSPCTALRAVWDSPNNTNPNPQPSPRDAKKKSSRPHSSPVFGTRAGNILCSGQCIF